MLESSTRARRWGLTLAPSTRVATSKTGEQDDSLEIGILDRAFLQQAIALRWRQTKTGDRLYPFSLSQYERGVASAVEDLKLEALRVTPHSFRHTGSSTDVRNDSFDPAVILRRGRWASALSVKRYIPETRDAPQAAPPHVLGTAGCGAAERFSPPSETFDCSEIISAPPILPVLTFVRAPPTIPSYSQTIYGFWGLFG